MSKLGKVIVIPVPENIDPHVVLGVVEGQLTKPFGDAPCPDWCWRMGHFGARLLDLDAMEQHQPPGAPEWHQGYEAGRNEALADVAKGGG